MIRSQRKVQKMADRSNMAKNVGQVRQEAHNIGSYLYVRLRRTWYYGGGLVAANTVALVYLLGKSLGLF